MTEFTNEGFNVGYKAGVLSERERIIALLNHEYWHSSSYLSGIHYDCLMCEAIELIKGEN